MSGSETTILSGQVCKAREEDPIVFKISSGIAVIEDIRDIGLHRDDEYQPGKEREKQLAYSFLGIGNCGTTLQGIIGGDTRNGK